MCTVEQHLASYNCTAARTRALAGHMRDDHGWTIFTSESDDYQALSAMHQVAHQNQQHEPP